MLIGKVLRPPRFGRRAGQRWTSAAAAGDARGAGGARRRLRRGGRRPTRPPGRAGAGGAACRAGKPAAGRRARRQRRAVRRPAAPAPAPGRRARRRPATERRRRPGAGAPAPTGSSTSYEIAYIAHAPLEPRAAVAEWTRTASDLQLTVWTGTQRPFGVRRELAEAFALPEEAVRVIAADTGSGYGGKHTGEAAVEAARLARAAGRPVKLVWTREEEFTWAYFRPAGVIDIRSAVGRRRQADRPGRPATTTPAARACARPTRSPTSATASCPPSRRCARARTAAWPPPPTTSPARPTWTSWRRWCSRTRWRSASAT